MRCVCGPRAWESGPGDGGSPWGERALWVPAVVEGIVGLCGRVDPLGRCLKILEKLSLSFLTILVV